MHLLRSPYHLVRCLALSLSQALAMLGWLTSRKPKIHWGFHFRLLLQLDTALPAAAPQQAAPGLAGEAPNPGFLDMMDDGAQRHQTLNLTLKLPWLINRGRCVAARVCAAHACQSLPWWHAAKLLCNCSTVQSPCGSLNHDSPVAGSVTLKPLL